MGPLILLVGLPILEIVTFVLVAGEIGWLWALGLVIATAVLGAAVVRAQGFATLGRAQRALARGESPSDAAAHAALAVLGGLLLVTPGFLADAAGVALLLPPVRAALIARAAPYVVGRVVVAGAGFSGAEDSELAFGDRRFGGPDGAFMGGDRRPREESAIDADYVDLTDGAQRSPGPDGPSRR